LAEPASLLQQEYAATGQVISTLPALSCGNDSAADSFRQIIENSTPEP
jgi:hypothetical protein